MKCTKKKKILYINNFYLLKGGAENYIFLLMEHLEKSGHEILIVSAAEREHLATDVRKEYFLKNSEGFKSSKRIYAELEDIICRGKPDLIHVFNTSGFMAPMVIGYLIKHYPVIKHVHDARLFCPNIFSKVFISRDEICHFRMGRKCIFSGCVIKDYFRERRDFQGMRYRLRELVLQFYELHIMKKAPQILVPSSYFKEELIYNGFAPERIEVACNFSVLPENTSEPEYPPLLLYIGRFDKVKGASEIPEILKFIPEHIKWKALLIGEGPEKTLVDDNIMKYNLQDRVEMINSYVPYLELKKLIRKSSVILVPSLVPESFGVVGIEAHVEKRPVVAYACGGIIEWLRDGENGYAVKRKDRESAAQMITRILENPELGKKLGENGYRRASELYTLDAHAEKILKIYEQVIENHKFSRANASRKIRVP